MPYKLFKKVPDSRINLCGLPFPNGFYHVIERTEENQRQLDNIKQHGYAVEFCELKPGIYTDDGREVDADSLHDFIYYGGPLVFKDGKKPMPEHADMASESLLNSLRGQCTAKGIKFREDAKATTLEKKLRDYDAGL